MTTNERIAEMSRAVYAWCAARTATVTDAEDLSSLGAQIEGTDCAVTFRELRPDVWKLSVRTGKRINATKVCAALGGGGHAAAAGASLPGTLEDAKQALIRVLKEEDII